MIKPLKRIKNECWYFVDGNKIEGTHDKISGDVSGISGDVSDIWGDVSYIRGNVSGIRGDVSRISGDVIYISGDVSGISGYVGCIRGDFLKIPMDARKDHPEVEYWVEDGEKTGWPMNIIADRQEVLRKWALYYLTDAQAELCRKALMREPSDRKDEAVGVAATKSPEISGGSPYNLNDIGASPEEGA